jgi:hypothetical protein
MPPWSTRPQDDGIRIDKVGRILAADLVIGIMGMDEAIMILT